MDTIPREQCFLSITADSLGLDPLPFYDPVTGARMQQARYNPVNVYAPRAKFTRKTRLPLSTAMTTFRRVWSDRVNSGLEDPCMVAHRMAGRDDRETWGEEATDAEIAHARRVAGKLARHLSDGVLRAL